MKTIIEILQEKQFGNEAIDNYRHNTLSGRPASLMINAVYSECLITEKEYERLKATINEKDKIIANNNVKIAELENNMDAQLKTIDSQRKRIISLEEALDECKLKLKEADELIKDKNTAIDTLDKQKNMLRDEVAKLTYNNTACNEKIEKQESCIDTQVKTIDSQREKKRMLKNTLNEYKLKLKEAEDKISKRDSAIDVIDEENTKLREELKAAKEACDTCPLMSLDTKYDMLNQAYNELDSQNYALKQAYELKDTQVGDLIQILSKLVND